MSAAITDLVVIFLAMVDYIISYVLVQGRLFIRHGE